MKDKVLKNKSYKQVKFVKLGSLPAIQKNGVLKFTIPGKAEQIEAKAKRVKAASSIHYEWYGEIENGTGHVIALNRNGKLTVNISLPDGEVYEFFYTDTDKHFMVQYDKEEQKNKQCGSNDSNTDTSKKTSFLDSKLYPLSDAYYSLAQKPYAFTYPIQSKGGPNNSEVSLPSFRVDPCNNYTRILILFTPNARAAVADIFQTADLCISNFNAAVYNSRITANAYVELAGLQQLDFVEGNGTRSDLDLLTTNPNVQALRNANNADLVILLTDGPYGGIYGEVDAIGPIESRAYSIVQITQATGGVKVFAHEVGHLFGCRHHWDPDNFYERGYVFKPSLFSTRRTIMVTGSGDDVILHFSNPNVSVDGCATGTSSRNNARKINETALTVNNFRASPFRPFDASVSGPGLGDACTDYTAEAVVRCGPPPYTYEWYRSNDGFNYGPLEGTDELFTTLLPCISGVNYDYFHLKLIVSSGDGQLVETVHDIVVQGDVGPPLKVNVGNTAVEQAVHTPTTLKLYPNPASSTVTYSFYLSNAQEVTFSLTDANGRIVNTSNKKLLAGTHNKTINIKDLKGGIYLVKVGGHGWVETQKLVVNH